MLSNKWHVSCADMSLSAVVLISNFCIDESEESSRLLLLRIWSKIPENALDLGSALLAYFDMYCKAACMLKTDLRSTFARQPCS